MGEFSCTYPGCTRGADHYFDEAGNPQYCCIFHAPVQKKQQHPGKFEEELNKQIEAGDCNFRGYVFPAEYSFEKDFKQFADFREVEFNGEVLFVGMRFLGHRRSGLTTDPVATFNAVRFNRVVWFRDVTFESDVDFSECQFNGRFSGFRDVSFSGSAHFLSIRVNSACLMFTRTKFLSGYSRFSGQVESGAVIIEEPTIQRALDFDNLQLSDDSEFKIRHPKFQVDEINSPAEIEKIPTIRFRNMKFVPFATVFESMQHLPVHNKDNELDILRAPIMLFRYCQLQDVFFRKCNISLLSFYACPFFEEAHFISCTDKWRKVSLLSPILPRITQRNIIFEDFLAKFLEKEITDTYTKNKIMEFYDVEDLLDYKELPTLYRRLKTASDRAKDYRGAGRFYFNEFETKRQASLRVVKNNPVLSRRFYSLIKYLTYTAYRIFAGYGEKPFRGFDWFWLFTLFFTVLHLLNGISVPTSDGKWKTINYDWDLPFGWIGTLFTSQFWNDVGYAFIFSLYRVIPTGYLPGLKLTVSIPHLGLSDFFLSFVNSFVLIMMIVFTGIGLKRHFRRF